MIDFGAPDDDTKIICNRRRAATYLSPVARRLLRAYRRIRHSCLRQMKSPCRRWPAAMLLLRGAVLFHRAADGMAHNLLPISLLSQPMTCSCQSSAVINRYVQRRRATSRGDPRDHRRRPAGQSSAAPEICDFDVCTYGYRPARNRAALPVSDTITGFFTEVAGRGAIGWSTTLSICPA